MPTLNKKKYDDYNYYPLTYTTSSTSTILYENLKAQVTPEPPKPKTAAQWLGEQVEEYCKLGRTLD